MRLFDPDRPFSPRRVPFFYGWLILGAAVVGILMSLPGQTAGVSVFTDHLIQATSLDRLQLSGAYFAGTLASGLLLPFGGRWIDRYGARKTALVAALALGGTVFLFGRVDRLTGGPDGAVGSTVAVFVLGFFLLRFSGQGMLTMVSRTMLGRWFDRRRGLVAGVSGVFIAFGFASAPPVLSWLIAGFGWRGAYGVMAGVVVVTMTCVGYVFYRDTPEACGLRMDGRSPEEEVAGQGKTRATGRDQTWQTALRRLAFWSLTLALSGQSLIITGITFHIVDLGAQNGFDEARVVAVFLPMAVMSTSVGLLVGVVADYVPVRALVLVMMVAQAIGIVGFANFDHSVFHWVGVLAMGFTNGFFGPLSTLALPRYFGRKHLGTISGVQMMCMVVGSAIGPAVFALATQSSGSYDLALHGALAFPALAVVLTLLARHPQAEAVA
ncbi:MAG: MFS transporter [Myxococcota bacterium]